MLALRRTLVLRTAAAQRAPVRALHATRSALAAPLTGHGRPLGVEYAKMNRSNIHVLDAPTLNSWREFPKGGIHKGNPWSFWYSPAVVPLFFPIIVAGGLCSWFLYR
jgi:hypothetical protein